MPEFKLEAFKHPKGRPPKRFIFTKNEYCEQVKMHGWDIKRQGEPKDCNPYVPPGGDQFLSTYKRIANYPEEEMISTTRIMQEQIKQLTPPIFDRRPMINFLTNEIECFTPKFTRCPEDCATEYVSTMHASYKMPYPYVMQPLSMKKTPFLQNRKFLWEDPEMSDDKFYDDSIRKNIARLQQHKGFRTVSYDPISGTYSDGTPAESTKKKCFPLAFSHVK